MSDDYTPLPARLPAAEQQIALARELSDMVGQGLTNLEMLEALSLAHPRTSWTLEGVARQVRLLTDRRDTARSYLDSKSLAMAKNIVENGKPSEHIRALEGRGVLASEERGAGITIIVGGDAHIALLHGPRPGDE